MKFYYRTFNFCLATIGMFLGFSQTVCAQYGVFYETQTKFQGKIEMDECIEAPSDVKVLAEIPQTKTIRELPVDSLGNFAININDFYYYDTIIFSISDYNSNTINIDSTIIMRNVNFELQGDKKNHYYLREYENEPYIFFLKCKKDSIVEEENHEELVALIQQALIPNEETFEEIFGEEEPPGEEPEIPVDEEEEVIEPDPVITESETESNETASIDPIQNMIIFPNPTKNDFSILTNGINANDMELIIMDASGKLVMKKDKNEINGKERIDISLHSAPGTYLIILQNENEKYSGRVVIQ